ncbi:MAG: hypothetical protein ACOX4H_11180 [Bacillota bacterium]
MPKLLSGYFRNQCPNMAVTLSGCFRNGCPDAAEIRNVYAWQIQEYKGRLFVSTFDDSSNMEVILTTLLANRAVILYNNT